MHNTITANELKTGGISRLDAITEESGEAIISVRGKPKYVVLTIAHYNQLRECELETAVAETRREIEQGRYVTETVAEHIRRITNG